MPLWKCIICTTAGWVSGISATSRRFAPAVTRTRTAGCGPMTSAHELRGDQLKAPRTDPEDRRRLLVSQIAPAKKLRRIAISRDTLAPLDARERDAGLSAFIFAGGTKSIQHDCPSP